jgi:hypothetical protein
MGQDNGRQPSDKVVDRLIATAIERGERARKRRIGVYSAATFAAAALTLGIVYNGGRDAAKGTVDAELGETTVIRLAYESTADRPDTTVAVELSDHLDLIGYTDTHDLTWTTALKKGVNVLELPVVLTESDDGELTVAFSSGNDSKRIRVRIRAAHHKLNEVRASPADLVKVLA